MSRTKDALRIAGIAIDALQMIQGLTKVGGDKAAAALEAIDKVVTSVNDGVAGNTSPELVERDLDALRAELLNNDAAIDARLRERFGK